MNVRALLFFATVVYVFATATGTKANLSDNTHITTQDTQKGCFTCLGMNVFRITVTTSSKDTTAYTKLQAAQSCIAGLTYNNTGNVTSYGCASKQCPSLVSWTTMITGDTTDLEVSGAFSSSPSAYEQQLTTSIDQNQCLYNTFETTVKDSMPGWEQGVISLAVIVVVAIVVVLCVVFGKGEEKPTQTQSSWNQGFDTDTDALENAIGLSQPTSTSTTETKADDMSKGTLGTRFSIVHDDATAKKDQVTPGATDVSASTEKQRAIIPTAPDTDINAAPPAYTDSDSDSVVTVDIPQSSEQTCDIVRDGKHYHVKTVTIVTND